MPALANETGSILKRPDPAQSGSKSTTGNSRRSEKAKPSSPPLPSAAQKDSARGELTTEELVAACRAEREDAFSELVRVYGGLAWTIARRQGLTQAEASEVTHAAFVTVWLNIAELRDPSRLASWIATIVRREIFAYLRSKSSQRKISQLSTDDDVTANDPADRIETLEIAQIVRDAIHDLPDRYQSLAEAMFLQSESANYDQIAVSLNIPRGSLGPMRQRLLELLRRRLEPIFRDYWDEGAENILGEAV